MRIRPANAEDVESISLIKVAAWRAAYKPFMPEDFLASLDHRQGLDNLISAVESLAPPFQVSVAVEGEQVVGYSFVGSPRFMAPPKTLELWALNIHPDYWRKGVGKELLNDFREQASLQSSQNLMLWCLEGNAPALALYESYGFARTGEVRTTTQLTGHPLTEVSLAVAA